MRLLQRVTKYALEAVTYPIDANPWLESIRSSFGAVVVGDAPDLVESYTVVAGVLTLRLTGGLAGTTYRVPVTFTAANGVSRAVIVEVSVAGVRPTTETPPVVSVVTTNIDGGTPSSNYGGLPVVDGGHI